MVQVRKSSGEHKVSKNVSFIDLMINKYAVHKPNDEVVNVLFELGLRNVTIALRPETTEVFYRTIMIKEFEESNPAQ